ncbi:MAG: non-homologous end-joining DNA ligase [Oligoflexales bacterium]
MSKDKDLEAYNKKRDFSKTSEPQGDLEFSSGQLKFFIQQHAATRMHYDFRLEFAGCLKSWAVPKGPSLNPLDQRLAVHVEDHPLAYGRFEGKIPPGNYGAGTVLLWDQGTYIERSSQGREDSVLAMLKGFEKGRLTFVLSGHKLCGEFALIRLKDSGSWLLMKKQDQLADYRENILEKNKSVLSGLSLAELSKQEKTDIWLPDKNTLPAEDLVVTLSQPKIATKDVATQGGDSQEAKSVSHYGMMHPILGTKHKFDSSWILFLKNPCYRAIAHIDNGNVRMYSHSKVSYKDSFKPAFTYLSKISQDLVFECEITVFDENNQQLSQQLLRSFHRTKQGNIKIFITDLLVHKNEDIRNKPFHYRLNQLRSLNIFDENIILKPEIHQEELEQHLQGEIKYFAKYADCIYQKGVSSCLIECCLTRSPSENTKRSDTSSDLLKLEKEENWSAPKFTPMQYEKFRSTDNIQFKNGPLISQLKKVLWPDEAYTKEDLVNYYAIVAGLILPYIKNRPISMHRHPKGIRGDSFFQKDLTGFIPSWFKTIRVKSAKKGFINYPLCQNEYSLLYLANLYCIELNPWMSRTEQLECPDQVYIDLDPSESNHFQEIVEVANHIRDILDKAKIRGFCKTSGSRGLHIMIPIVPNYSFTEARSLAKKVCELTVARLPNLTSIERSKSKRKDQIYLDYMQNYHGQTIASVYCVRPVPGALVSTPLRWSEVNEDLDPKKFNINSVISRLNQLGDLWYASTEVQFDVKECLKNLENVA